MSDYCCYKCGGEAFKTGVDCNGDVQWYCKPCYDKAHGFQQVPPPTEKGVINVYHGEQKGHDKCACGSGKRFKNCCKH